MKKLLFTAVSAILLSTGCSTAQEHNHQQAAPVLKYVLGSDDWSVLKQQNASAEVIEAYQFAIAHPEVLQYMPCYCGCGDEAGHKSNVDCFVNSVQNNEALLDTMGFG